MEIDGLIAHLYKLREAEFIHILSMFPLAAFGAAARGEIGVRDHGYKRGHCSVMRGIIHNDTHKMGIFCTLGASLHGVRYTTIPA